VLKQRNALLRSAHGRMSADIEATLAVWDAKFVDAGEAWADARADLVDRLVPRVVTAYDHLAGAGHDVELVYAPTWRKEGLGAALAEVRRDEVRRGVTLVGPHRDELVVGLASLPARTQASQGEQRTLALALRIAGHHEIAAVCGTSPLLVLDDVFSELDGGRVDALMSLLVADQTFVTTAASTAPITADAGWWTVIAGTMAPGRPES
jgi:DNA replication and repair protein RecF